jgi:glycolate oxidase FAD binding subunit
MNVQDGRSRGIGMESIAPSTINEFAEAYGSAYAAGRSIRIVGADTKRRYAGPIFTADLTLSTKALTQVEEYNPRDLSIRVQAGMPYKQLCDLLARNGQMLPFDPPYQEDATIGGVVAANICGPRQRAYGTARDYVIGVQFADHRGRLVQSGAMVAKNVAGYDLNKLFVGSWGVLGPVLTLNLRVSPIQKYSATFAIYGLSGAEPARLRDALLRAAVPPIAVDYVNNAAADKMRLDDAALLVRFSCFPAVLDRVRADLAERGFTLPEPMNEETEFYVWQRVREWLKARSEGNVDGVVLQISSINSRVFFDANAAGGQVLARAASGIVWAAYRDSESALDTLQYMETQGRRVCVLQASQAVRAARKLWVGQQSDVSIMQKLKSHFDPSGLVNKGRLYGCI